MVLSAASSNAAAADPPAPPPSAPVESVVVTAQKLAVETLIDRKVYSIATDVQATFGTVSDVLSAIPSVDVDPDGNVSLRGDSSVLILIDGKPSTQLSGSAAGDNLQSIPAKDIERIEVMTTPPAQFKAEGAAGVINIITRRQRPPGYSGSAQASLGSSGREVFGADSSYTTAHLTVSATGSFRHDIRQRMIRSDVTALDPTTGLPTASTSALSERLRRQVPTAALSARYAPTERQTVTGSFSWSERGGLRTYTQLNDTTDASGALTGSTRRFSSGHDPETDYDERLGFTQALGRTGEALDLSLHRSTSHQREHYDYTNDSFVPPAATTFNNLNLREDRSTTEFGADYALAISKTRSLKLGYAFERHDFRYGNLGNNVDPVTGAQTVDPTVTNDFEYRLQVSSVYASYQTSVGAWNWLTGLRAERTRTDALQLTGNASNSGSYSRLYPSVHVDRNLSDNSTLSFGASRRIRRPDVDNFDPYVDHEYTPNLTSGNPGLKPQYTQSYEAGYGVEGPSFAYQLTGYYRRAKDSVTDVTEYLGNGFSLTTKANLPKNASAGLEFTSSGRIVPKLAYSLSGNLFRSQIDATAFGVPGLQTTTGVNAKLKLDYRPTSADSAQLTVTRTDKRLTAQGYVSAINLVNLGYRRRVQADLTAIVTVSDVFNGQHFERTEITPTFRGDYLRRVRGRVLYVGAVYTFGSAKQDKPASFDYDQPN